MPARAISISRSFSSRGQAAMRFKLSDNRFTVLSAISRLYRGWNGLPVTVHV
jgi:hypothetical protein